MEQYWSSLTDEDLTTICERTLSTNCPNVELVRYSVITRGINNRYIISSMFDHPTLYTICDSIIDKNPDIDIILTRTLSKIRLAISRNWALSDRSLYCIACDENPQYERMKLVLDHYDYKDSIYKTTAVVKDECLAVLLMEYRVILPYRSICHLFSRNMVTSITTYAEYSNINYPELLYLTNNILLSKWISLTRTTDPNIFIPALTTVCDEETMLERLYLLTSEYNMNDIVRDKKLLEHYIDNKMYYCAIWLLNTYKSLYKDRDLTPTCRNIIISLYQSTSAEYRDSLAYSLCEVIDRFHVTSYQRRVRQREDVNFISEVSITHYN